MHTAIVITGAIGNVGEWVVRGPLEAGQHVRVAVPTPDGAKRRFGPGSEYV